MAQSLKGFFGRRRSKLVALTAFAVVLTLLFVYLLDISLQYQAFFSGVLLYGVLIILSLFNSRKKLPFIPLLKVSTWLQIHIYVGYFSVALFLIHIGGRWPSGVFESVLASVFTVVALSGFAGLAFSRMLPPRMARSGEAIIYERVPKYRRQIREEVMSFVQEIEKDAESSTLSHFYASRLQPFFDRDPGFFFALRNDDTQYISLIRETGELKRYLNDVETEALERINQWLEEKRNLDFQFAAMRLLKYWLFLHIPFTASLMILGLVHGFIALIYANPF